MRIKIICYDCQHINRQELGMPNFELLDTKFDFSDAYHHMKAYPNHHMVIKEILDDDSETN